jgi:phage repressor protein C with HTH and peptisase S24 domain
MFGLPVVTAHDSSSAAFDIQQKSSIGICANISGATKVAAMKSRRALTAQEAQDAARLRAIFKARQDEAKQSGKRLTQEDVAVACGWSGQSAFGQYYRGVIPLNTDALLALAKVLRFAPEEVSPSLAETLYKVPLGRPKIEANAELLGPISPWDDDTPLDDDEVALPLLKHIEVAGGKGRVPTDYDSGRKIRLGKYTLRNQGVQFDQAVCVTVTGNSMEPALPEGSTVGVNLGNTTVKDGKVYVISHAGELRVKQLYRLPGGGIRLRSFNRAEHEDEDYSQEQMIEKDIAIVGKVFWSSVLWD